MVCWRIVLQSMLGINDQFHKKHTMDHLDCTSTPTLYASTASGCVSVCHSAWNSRKAVSILCWRFPSSSTKYMVDVFVFISAFRFNAAKSFCQRTFASSKVQQAPCPMFGVNGWEASPASVNPSHTCDELSCEFMLYLRELLTMFSIDVFSIHRKVGQDHPCMSFRASTLNNVRSFDEPAAQPTLGKRTLA